MIAAETEMYRLLESEGSGRERDRKTERERNKYVG